MSSNTDISPLSQLLMRIDAAADGLRPADGIGTGFPSLDELLGGGLRAGDLVVLGGDVGAGKSSLALAMAIRARLAGRAVAFLTGEMAPARVLERILAIEGRCRIDDLRRGTVDDDARVAIGAAALRMREALPVVDRSPAGGVPELAALAAGIPDAELLVVDSLQCLTTGVRPHHEELATAAAALKALALDRGIAVLVTAHLAGRTTGPAGARPTLDDFGALGALKQLADVVLALYREEMYEGDRGSEGATELMLLKNRNGPLSYIDLYFYKQWLRFEDMVEPAR